MDAPIETKKPSMSKNTKMMIGLGAGLLVVICCCCLIAALVLVLDPFDLDLIGRLRGSQEINATLRCMPMPGGTGSGSTVRLLPSKCVAPLGRGDAIRVVIRVVRSNNWDIALI